MSATVPRRRPARPFPSAAIVAYVAALAAGAVVVTAALALLATQPPGRATWAVLPVLAVLLVVAECLLVRLRYGGEVEGLNLVDAALAPLIFAFPAVAVLVTVALAQVAGGVVRRNAPLKVAFNAAMWCLAAATGSAVLAAVSGGPGSGALRSGLAVLAALVVVAAVNTLAFAWVLRLVEGRPVRKTLPLSRIRLAGWAVNAAVGLLFVAAYVGAPLAVLAFFGPLVVLHLAYRGYATERAERVRLSGLRRAARVLSAPLDPREAVGDYLREVAGCFEANEAVLLLRAEQGLVEVFHHREGDDAVRHALRGPGAAEPLELGLLAEPTAVHVSAVNRHPLSAALAATGHRECLSAPLLDDGRVAGAVLVLDQAGLEGQGEAELGVVEALARETWAALAKGRLLARMLEERRRSSEIVASTSDGILTVTTDGIVTTWNRAMERITGRSADDVLGRPGAWASLRACTPDGEPVDVAEWQRTRLPTDVRVAAADGSLRQLTCSYSTAGDEDGPARTLIVVARDVTAAMEHEALRRQVDRLVEADEVRRLAVEQLQRAVTPEPPSVPGVDLAVAYVPSEESSPTGGDLYDWLVLPNGELHIAVVDVLGHGVVATKDALAVVHALRLVAADGTPLQDAIRRAGELLAVQNSELVATVMLARYDPSNGSLRVASGGHPPAVIASPGRGSAEFLEPLGGAIGWPGMGSDGLVETTLEPGDVLVLYTDGLVEARKDLPAGLDRLREVSGAVAHLPAGPLAEELLARALDGAQRRDDSLALVLRRVPMAAPVPASMWRFPPRTRSVPEVRQEFGLWLAGLGIEGAEAMLVASELMTNAVAAGRAVCVLRVEVGPSGIVFEAYDDGVGEPGLQDAGTLLPDVEEERGRGLFLVRALCGDVTVRTGPRGTVVRTTLAVDRPQTPRALDDQRWPIRTGRAWDVPISHR